MKASIFLQLVAAASALVLPDQDVLAEIEVQPKDTKSALGASLSSVSEIVDSIGSRYDTVTDQIHDAYKKYAGKAHYAFDEAMTFASDAYETTTQELSESYFDAQAWVEARSEDFVNPLGIKDCPRTTTKGGHHERGNQTVYQLISESKYTTKLTELINEFPDLVEALNGTEANYTIFAPTDRAFDKIPDKAPKPSKEVLKKVLEYHVSPKFYPAGRVLVTRTIPTLLQSEDLADEPVSQRLATEVSFKGLTVNFYSRIVAINIFGSNGVIHGVDSILIPPPSVLKIIDLVPEQFSTLELGLFKTGLFEEINGTAHTGGTFFAPSNFAFSRLGARTNAFLFSPPGLKYLKALLEYHLVANQTLYSDYYLDGRSSDGEAINVDRPRRGPPRGYQHFDLDTVLEGKSLAVDVSRYGRLIDITINGYTKVAIPDGIAKDGVIHEITNVLIPPHKHHHHHDDDAAGFWTGDNEMSVEDLKERLEPYVAETFVPTEL